MLSRSHQTAEAVTVSYYQPTRPAAPPVRGPIRIPLARRRMIYGVLATLWISGGLWLVFHYFLQAQGEFGPEPNALEPWWLKLHGAAAFLAVWAFGLLWGVHVVNGWRARRRRWTGGTLFGVALILIGTGYLLYYAGGDQLRSIVSIVHWGVGLGAPIAFLVHRYFVREASAPARPDDESRRPPS